MKKIFTTILLVTISSFLFSQEICDNGIDDDGDGLIDLNDTTDCVCTGQGTPISIPSLIPNPSFEDHSCCPTTYGIAGQTNDGLGCADDWQQAGGATSDYFNTCGWNGASNSLPFPDGDAAVGVFSVDGWCEFVGGCLLGPMIAGTQYQITFSLGFDAMTGTVQSCSSPNGYSGPIDFTLYGTPDCNDIPFSGYDCPIGQGQWVELGHVNIDASTIFHSWEEVTISFTPGVNINGFALGPPCDVGSYGYGTWGDYGNDCAPYFLVDNLIMNETAYFNSHLSIDSIGSSCTNLTFNAHPDTVGTFQWYHEGIAIAGETDSIIDITGNNYPEGTYQVVFDYGTDCLVGEMSFVGTPATILVSNDTTICEGGNAIISASGCDTYAWDNSLGTGNTHTVSPANTTTYTVTGANVQGCTDVGTVTVTVVPNPTSPFTITNVPCFGDILDITYTGNADNTATYAWNFESGNIISGSGQGPYQINWDTVGTFDISLVVANGACISQQTLQSSNNPELVDITASNDTTICAGGSAIISASGNAVNYAWNNGAGGGSSVTVSPNNTTIYTVVGSNANACTDIDTVIVTVIQVPTADFTIEEIPCYQDSCIITYTGMPGSSPVFDWTFTSGNIISGSGQGPYTIFWPNNGTFPVSLQVTNGVCVSPLNTQDAFKPEELNATTSGTNLLCYNDVSTGSVSVVASGGTVPYSYNWNSSETSTSVTGTPAGNYIVTVTDNNQCSVIRPISIYEPSQLVVSLPPDFYMCADPSELIQSSVAGGVGNYLYEWNNSATTLNINISPIDETMYTLIVTDANNCTAVDNILVMIHPPLIIDAYSDLDTVCPGDPVLLDINITGGSGNPYEIYMDGNIVTMPVTVYPTNNQAFNFVVKDNCDNEATDIVQIINYPKPPLSFTSDILNGCVPLAVKFNETSTCDNCTYSWNFGDDDGISYSNNSNPLHIFENAGLFDVSCDVISENGCRNSLVIFNMIEVYPKPDAAFLATPDVASIINPIIDFNNLSEDNEVNYWSFGDGDSSQIINPYHKYPAIGYYDVQLIVISKHNCVDTVRATIRIKDEFTFYAPTAFSPDGDGINDAFKVVGSGIDLDEFTLTIYDRWGEVIWETNDIYQGWDGKLKENGKTAQIGTYTWRCVFKDMNGVEREETGPVTLVK